MHGLRGRRLCAPEEAAGALGRRASGADPARCPPGICRTGLVEMRVGNRPPLHARAALASAAGRGSAQAHKAGHANQLSGEKRGPGTQPIETSWRDTLSHGAALFVLLPAPLSSLHVTATAGYSCFTQKPFVAVWIVAVASRLPTLLLSWSQIHHVVWHRQKY